MNRNVSSRVSLMLAATFSLVVGCAVGGASGGG
ncbi:MAG: hypothetical protein JWM82_491, partial [Myxococcales bacterium]|nr:hypothetical protein [Myxococcales bacterium]